MNKIDIKFDKLSFIRSKSGKITGGLWVSTKNKDFPAEGWNDFVVIILSWWLQELRTLSLRESNSVFLRFMDGPYHIAVSSISDTHAKVEFIDHHSKSEMVGNFVFSISEFGDAIAAVATDVYSIAKEEKWEDNDLKLLKRAIDQWQS
ncbi:hypothetical protein ACO0LO_24480 [Undibacterium sp. TJN25]|uniref:hypothetical protein n=1 Tax=Undibacterium sp. TJN25 TaxID=3413056 RepID=UPI003BF2233D